MNHRSAWLAIAVLLLAIMLGARPSAAGWLIDEQMNGIAATGGQPVLHQVMLQSNRMKRLTLSTDGGPTHAFIVNLDADTITQVDYQRRQYLTGTVQEFAQMAANAMKMMQDAQGPMADAMARMRESMKHMSPEQRKLVEDMMRPRTPQPGASVEECRQPEGELRKTGQEATIAGYRAAQYEVVADGKVQSEIWLAKDLTAWQELDPQKLQHFAAEILKIARCAPAQIRSNLPLTDQAMKHATEGYAVRAIVRNGGNASTEVVKAISQPLPDAEFEAPAGFVRKSFSDMMRR